MPETNFPRSVASISPQADAHSALAENLACVEEAIRAACRAAQRPRAEVELMAVTKTHPVATIREAAELGLTLIGENRVQEYAAKAPELDSLRAIGLRAHLIGHLQSNKALRAAELFDAVDSVDSLKLAERLQQAAEGLNRHLPILLEIKLSPEESKAGLDPNSREAAELLERLPALDRLELRGLMTIAPLGVSDEETRACFRQLRQLRERWAAAYTKLDFSTLSMGMSGDFESAIAEGATRIRVGSALFGQCPALKA
jgi:pyridoxal phosphate enzyme (YggS family)